MSKTSRAIGNKGTTESACTTPIKNQQMADFIGILLQKCAKHELD